MKRSTRFLSLLCVTSLFLIIFASDSAIAVDYYVPGDYDHIQDALDDVAPGNTIIVLDGVYTHDRDKNLSFGGKALTLRSENGASNCIIDCGSDGRGFHFFNGETSASVVQGFTVTNGSISIGAGIYCYSASPTITDCIITNNTAGAATGIYCYNSSAIITGCTVADNSTGTSTYENGGGIWCSASSPNISDCTIRSNTAGDDGGGIWLASSGGSITDCTISANSAGLGGGGIWCGSSSTTAISGCTIVSNEAQDGGGIHVTSSTPTISGCTIHGNTATNVGGGIECWYSSPPINDCSIVGNSSNFEGGGIFCGQSSPSIINCTIDSNSAADDGGGIHCTNTSLPDIFNCAITSNTSGKDGGAIYCWYSSPSIESCTISRNAAAGYGGGVACFYSSPTITDCILLTDFAATGTELALESDSHVAIGFSDFSGVPAAVHVGQGCSLDPGPGNISANPLFVTGPLGNYYLSQIASGQLSDSPCMDAGSDTATNLGLDTFTTRTDHLSDGGTADMGYHYPGTPVQPLTRITCISPADEALVSSAPTFTWKTDGGGNRAFIIDIAPSLSGPIYSTPVLYDTRWQVPATVWSIVPAGTTLYWRVRGADLNVTPLTIITSDEIFSFQKP